MPGWLRGTGTIAPRKVINLTKSWKFWAGVVILVAAGVGGYFGFNALTDSGAEDGTAQTQLVPVTRGTLVNDVSVTGTLTYATRETVSFGQQGIVSEIPVSEGDKVSAGDALAMLDDEDFGDSGAGHRPGSIGCAQRGGSAGRCPEPLHGGTDRQGRVRRGECAARPPGSRRRVERAGGSFAGSAGPGAHRHPECPDRS